LQDAAPVWRYIDTRRLEGMLILATSAEDSALHRALRDDIPVDMDVASLRVHVRGSKNDPGHCGQRDRPAVGDPLRAAKEGLEAAPQRALVGGASAASLRRALAVDEEDVGDAFQARLEEMYRQSGAGDEPHPPAFLCMVTLLQGYVGASDAEAVEL